MPTDCTKRHFGISSCILQGLLHLGFDHISVRCAGINHNTWAWLRLRMWQQYIQSQHYTKIKQSRRLRLIYYQNHKQDGNGKNDTHVAHIHTHQPTHAHTHAAGTLEHNGVIFLPRHVLYWKHSYPLALQTHVACCCVCLFASFVECVAFNQSRFPFGFVLSSPLHHKNPSRRNP